MNKDSFLTSIKDEDAAADAAAEKVEEAYFAPGSEISEPKPEYVQCVIDRHRDRVGLAWCGQSIEGFAFVDIDHAAMNGRNEGRLMVCRFCRRAIVKALANGWEDES